MAYKARPGKVWVNKYSGAILGSSLEILGNDKFENYTQTNEKVIKTAESQPKRYTKTKKKSESIFDEENN